MVQLDPKHCLKSKVVSSLGLIHCHDYPLENNREKPVFGRKLYIQCDIGMCFWMSGSTKRNQTVENPFLLTA